MKFYSKLYCELYIFDKNVNKGIVANIPLNTVIKKMSDYTSLDWKKIKALQGARQVFYLKFKYVSWFSVNWTNEFDC